MQCAVQKSTRVGEDHLLKSCVSPSVGLMLRIFGDACNPSHNSNSTWARGFWDRLQGHLEYQEEGNIWWREVATAGITDGFFWLRKQRKPKWSKISLYVCVGAKRDWNKGSHRTGLRNERQSQGSLRPASQNPGTPGKGKKRTCATWPWQQKCHGPEWEVITWCSSLTGHLWKTAVWPMWGEQFKSSWIRTRTGTDWSWTVGVDLYREHHAKLIQLIPSRMWQWELTGAEQQI